MPKAWKRRNAFCCWCRLWVVRLGRILRRWLRQNLGREPCAYRPTWAMLGNMFRWTWAYQTGADGVRARAEQFSQKLTVIRSKRELQHVGTPCRKRRHAMASLFERGIETLKGVGEKRKKLFEKLGLPPWGICCGYTPEPMRTGASTPPLPKRP